MKAIETDLGGLDKLKAEAMNAGLNLLGSGWVWLVLNRSGKLCVTTTHNHLSPLCEGKFPLFGIDLWEHAYCLKYHTSRQDYLKAIWNLINWDYVSIRHTSAVSI